MALTHTKKVINIILKDHLLRPGSGPCSRYPDPTKKARIRPDPDPQHRGKVWKYGNNSALVRTVQYNYIALLPSIAPPAISRPVSDDILKSSLLSTLIFKYLCYNGTLFWTENPDDGPV
jgi:hypothetical protein